MAVGDKPKILFIGLGKMGLPMAQRLLEGGYAVTGSDRSSVAIEAFETLGGKAGDPTQAAAQKGVVVITMLPDGGSVRKVLLGERGLAPFLGEGACIIDMSSSAPEGTQQLQRDLSALGIPLVDAPVSGGVKKAMDGTLAIMAGGERADIERVTPILSCMGAKIFRAGPIGAGHAMKALNNFVSAAGLTALCEALLVGERFGIDGEAMVDILNASTGRNNSSEVKAKPFILSGRYDSGFALALMSKDIGIAAALAESLNLDTPNLRQSNALWAEALAELGPEADHTEIFKMLAARKGE